MSPRKVRKVVDAIRGKKVVEAMRILSVMPKVMAGPVGKLVSSAVSNAKNGGAEETDNLKIKEIRVDGGVVLKRGMPRAFGSMSPIRKKTSKITLVLSEQDKSL